MPKDKTQKPAARPAGGRPKDDRFAGFESNPRYKLPSKKHAKTTIDKRFARMLDDRDFTANAKVDRYGRKLKSDAKKSALKKLYQEEEEEQPEGEDDDEDDSSPEVEDDEVVERELGKANNAKFDPARGGGFSSSESDSDDSDSDSGDGDGDNDDGAAVAENSTSMQRLRDAQSEVETGEVTKRIAVVNLDWDHIKSSDLMALFSSFAPKGGRVEKVSIYPSHFGKERMQREELEGPPKEIFKASAKDGDEDLSSGGDDDDDDDDSADDDDDDDDEKIREDMIEEGNDQDFNSDALRSYQLDRLRYYYAVMECSDPATAEKIYHATDGSEYQASSNFLDLRFVPDDVSFDDDEPRDACDSVPADYRPTEFITDALQHSKVKLTWDLHPEDAERKESIKRAFSGSRAELQENDLRAYLASDSEGDDDDEGGEPGGERETAQAQGEEGQKEETQPKLSKKQLKAQRMREALGLSAEPAPSSKSSKSSSGPVGDMEITFAPALMDGKSKKKGAQGGEEAEETTIEKYMRKERERKARKKEKSVAKRDGEGEGEGEGGEGGDSEEEGRAMMAAGSDGDGDGEDLGFDDPFFTTADEPSATAAGAKSKTAERKEERLKRRQAREAEAAEDKAQKAQLRRVLGEDADRVAHFDMSEIAKAEKLKAKKGKKGKKGAKKKKGGDDDEDDDEGGAAAAQDNFKVDVGDDRFKKLFDDHTFAIDPSHPQFKATPGMKQLMEEGRKKRKNAADGDDDDDGDEDGRGASSRQHKSGKSGAKKQKTNDDLASLVESVKRKAKSRR